MILILIKKIIVISQDKQVKLKCKNFIFKSLQQLNIKKKFFLLLTMMIKIIKNLKKIVII